ncbi:hypothetical protein PTKIN_Ptkin14bG0071000 [Pterospermum kingtungense]
MELFREMSQNGTFPNTVTYTALINGLSRLGRLSVAKELFKKMSAHGLVPDVITYSTLLCGFCKNGLTNEAYELFRKMEVNGRLPNSISYNVMIQERLYEMETVGLSSPLLGSLVAGDALGFHKIFQAFTLRKRVKNGISRWYYPWTLENLAFDQAALRIAPLEPLDSVGLYLSRATLVVFPSNLVDHWKTQIQKHMNCLRKRKRRVAC